MHCKGGRRGGCGLGSRPHEERDRLWPRVIADHKNYAGYQARTTREIALVLLEPPD